MAAPEWAELDSLTQAINDLRVRQEAAKSIESHDLVATIEQEIAQLWGSSRAWRTQGASETAQKMIASPHSMLLKPVRGAILATKPPEAGECRLS